MDRKDFNLLLKSANLTKKEFAEIIGMKYSSVNNWGGSQKIPRWVKSWLENYIEANKDKKEESEISATEMLEALSKIELIMKNNKFKDTISILDALGSLNDEDKENH